MCPQMFNVRVPEPFYVKFKTVWILQTSSNFLSSDWGLRKLGRVETVTIIGCTGICKFPYLKFSKYTTYLN